MTERLIIDLAACDRCESCAVECGGLLSLREKATFELVCRRCAQASCILACPFDALERLDDGGVIRRHNLRCVSCKLCAQACPFGTIYPELLPFYSLSYESCCGACLETTHDTSEPYCVAACPEGALEWREIDTAETGIHVLDDHLAARADKWIRDEPVPEATA